MKALGNALIILIFISSAAIAKPASEKSIKEVLKVTHAQNILGAVRGQISYTIDNIAQQILKGKPPEARQKEIIAHFKNKMNAAMDRVLTWKKIEADDIKIYKETFTEKEMQGILSFYKTPAGQAFIKKTPLLAKKRLTAIQKTISTLEPQLQKIGKDFATAMRASTDQATSSSPPATSPSKR
jgi:hypothetical protein